MESKECIIINRFIMLKWNFINLLLIFILFFSSCSRSFINNTYSYLSFNNNRDLQVDLIFFEDSTFLLKDIYGRKQFTQKGTWRLLNVDSNSSYNLDFPVILLTDTPMIEERLSSSHHGLIEPRELVIYISNYDGKYYRFLKEVYMQFPLIEQDTVYFYPNNWIEFRNLHLKKSNGTTDRIYYKQMEKYYLTWLGKKNFLLFFKAKNKKEARKKMIEREILYPSYPVRL